MSAVLDLPLKQELVKECNVRNGWFESDRTFSDDIALLHSEVSEALEAYRDHGFGDATAERGHSVDCAQISGPATVHECTCGIGLDKPEGIGSEMADILVRLLDTSERHEVNLEFEREFVEKRMASFDMGQTVGYDLSAMHAVLSECWAIHEGFAPAKVGWKQHLALLLSMVEVFCEDGGIDIEYEFQRKLAYNATRGHRHGGKRL